jgi:hypothetical protein
MNCVGLARQLAMTHRHMAEVRDQIQGADTHGDELLAEGLTKLYANLELRATEIKAELITMQSEHPTIAEPPPPPSTTRYTPDDARTVAATIRQKTNWKTTVAYIDHTAAVEVRAATHGPVLARIASDADLDAWRSRFAPTIEVW